MLPLRDDGASTLGGLVNALLGVRTTGNRTHEVVVHSPGYLLNGGSSIAKAASMSELVRQEKIFCLSVTEEKVTLLFLTF